MMAAFHDTINNTPPLYFVLGWSWSRLFGASALSLRLFSCLGISVGSWFTWLVLRRNYGFWPTTLAVLSVFCLSTMVLSQNAEARMYGLYLAVSAAGIWLYDEINKRTKLDWKILLVNVLLQAAIVHTHIFGCLYSSAIFAALVLNDWYHKRFRFNLYASFVLGWLTFLLYVPALLIQADAGNPRSWLFVPSVRYLIDVLTFKALTYDYMSKRTMVRGAFFMVAALIPAIVYFRYISFLTAAVSKVKANALNTRGARHLLLLAYLFLLIPVGMWVFSHIIKPAFWDRYFLPSVLSWPILFASIFSIPVSGIVNYLERFTRLNIYRFIPAEKKYVWLAVLAGLLLLWPVYHAIDARRHQIPGRQDHVFGYEHLPVVVMFSHDFMERIHHSPQKQRYHAILDWEVAVDSTSGLMAPQFHKHLAAWKRSYPAIFADNVTTNEDFLSKHRQFLVLGFPWECDLEKKLSNGFCDRWIYMRIVNNPAYKVTILGDTEEYRRLFLVEALE
jgi:hypothetical protein